MRAGRERCRRAVIVDQLIACLDAHGDAANLELDAAAGIVSLIEIAVEDVSKLVVDPAARSWSAHAKVHETSLKESKVADFSRCLDFWSEQTMEGLHVGGDGIACATGGNRLRQGTAEVVCHIGFQHHIAMHVEA